MFEIIENSQPRILVIGDLMIDNYLKGDCHRISPEAPVPIIDIKSSNHVLGGAGNVINNLKSLGADVSVISVIGNCNISKEIEDLLKNIDVEINHLVHEKDRVASKKTRIISSQQQVIRFDSESCKDISKSSKKILLERFSDIISKHDLVILSDYGKGVLTSDICQQIIQISNNNNIKVIVDPKGNDFSKYNSAYLLTPNLKEASTAFNRKIDSEDDLRDILKSMKKECNLNIALITLSEDGIAILSDKFQNFPTVAREVFDVTGAGDTVIAALGFAIAVNLNISSSIQFANIAAGVVVGKIGSATASIDEIRNYKTANNKFDCEEKIKSPKDIEAITKKFKALGKKIIFTNGCFDILHYGHVKYLAKASELGDILILGLNSDSSIKRIKGNSRPINALKERACILGSLEFIDYVVPFSEDTPKKLISKILPNILVKGSDYFNKEVAGKEFAQEVVLIDYIDGKSTTNIINQILTNE